VLNDALSNTPGFSEKDRVEGIDDRVAIFYFEGTIVLFTFLANLSESCGRTRHALYLTKDIDIYLNGDVPKELERLLDDVGVGTVVRV